MKWFKFPAILAASMLIAILFSSCDKQMEESARMKFKLTDAPGDYEAVLVEVASIEVHTEADGWMSFDSDLGQVNLLAYANGATTLIAEAEVPRGRVDAIRLVLGDDNFVVVDGDTFALQTPSAMQSGLKIDLNADLQAEGEYEWTLDFDAGQSIVEMGNGEFNLKPVIRLLLENGPTISGEGSGSGSAVGSGSGVVMVDSSGNITGEVQGLLSLANVSAIDAQGHIVSTYTDASGRFTLSAIQEGDYSVSINPVSGPIATQVITEVHVEAGATTNLGLIGF